MEWSVAEDGGAVVISNFPPHRVQRRALRPWLDAGEQERDPVVGRRNVPAMGAHEQPPRGRRRATVRQPPRA